MQLRKIINSFEFFYPPKYAAAGDKVGLEIGDYNKDVHRIMCAFEITNDVVDEAIDKDVDLIICHHPLFYIQHKNFNYDNPWARKVARLIKNDIAVYSAHTNVDIYMNGMSDWICQLLKIKTQSVLSIVHSDYYKKIEMEVSQENLYRILEILENIGAGKSRENNQKVNITPFVEYKKSKKNKPVNDDMLMLSFYLNDEQLINLKKELAKFKFDKTMDKQFYVFEQKSRKKDFGFGRVGKVRPQTLEDLAFSVKNTFGLDHVKISGNREQIVSNIAVVGGAGSDFIDDAANKNADVLITGDIDFHSAQDAIDKGLCLIDASHYVEVVFNDVITEMLSVMFDIDVIASEVDVNPFEVI